MCDSEKKKRDFVIKKSLVLFLLIFIFASSYAQNIPNPETRGVWITGNYLKGGQSAIESMMQGLKAANFNVIYIDVWYRGYTIYPSTVIQDAGGPLQNPDFVGTDPLKTTIEIAHKYGIEVFAWFEYGFKVGYGSDSTEVPGILKTHPDWSMLQRDTTKNFYHNANGYFFEVDPGVGAASNFAVNLYTECAKNYPDLDGIESDIEDDTTGSYSDTSRIRFMQETGNPDPLTLSGNNPAWLSWRRLQITNIMKRSYESVKKVNPKCIVSGAVPPPYMSNYMLESWNIWADSGYVDMLEPMLYLPISEFPSQWNVSKSYVPTGFNLSSGIAVNSAGSVGNTIEEINDARSTGSTGQVIWYYGYLLSYPNILYSLESNVYSSTTAPSFDDLLMDDAMGLLTTTGTWNKQIGGFNGGYFKKSSAIPGDTAIFKVRILRDGLYSLFGYWSGDSSSNSNQAILEISSMTIHNVDTVNQKTGLNTWNFVNKFNLSSGDTVIIKLFGTNGAYLIADAFRLKRVSPFQIENYSISDSQSVLLRFSNPLLTPIPNSTKITSSINASNLNFYIDTVDNSVIHIIIPVVSKGTNFQLNIENLIDIYRDTLNLSTSITYNPGGGLKGTLTTVWQKSISTGNLPSWFTTNSEERNIAYNNIGGKDRLYVVNAAHSLVPVLILDATTGDSVGTLGTTGISGGTFPLDDIETSSDGIIFACNLTVNAQTSAFKVYEWSNESAKPTAIISYADSAYRLGDHITVTGSTADNSITIWAAASGKSEAIKFTTTDHGASFTAHVILLNGAQNIGTFPKVYPAGSNFFVSSDGVGIREYDGSGNFLGSIASASISSGSMAYLTAGSPANSYILEYDYSSELVRVANITGGIDSAIALTPILGTAANLNGTGDVAFKNNSDGTVTIFVLGTNNGLGAYTFNPVITGIKEGNSQNIPSSFSLSQNYPNPFNPSTIIKFSLAQSGNVSLRIYNIMGQLVKTVLDNVYRNKGDYNYQVTMDNLSSGIYFYTLIQGNQQITQKMVFMK